MENQTWTQKVILAMWTHLHERWIQRSKIVNGSLNSPSQEFINQRAREMYETVGRLPRRFRFLFRREEEEWQREDPKKATRWIQRVDPVIRRQLRKQERRSTEGRRMEIWLRYKRRKGRRRK